MASTQNVTLFSFHKSRKQNNLKIFSATFKTLSLNSTANLHNSVDKTTWPFTVHGQRLLFVDKVEKHCSKYMSEELALSAKITGRANTVNKKHR
jgi:hypothetical protein